MENTTTHTVPVLFSRKGNENASTPLVPVAEWRGQVSLDASGTFCIYWDNDMLVQEHLYEVRMVELPSWLSADEWAKQSVRWRYTWGAGVDQSWPESWQRDLAELNFRARYLISKLLRVQKFRSDFRRSLQERVIVWLETSPEDRAYACPLSPRQLDCLEYNRWDTKRAEEGLYRDREYGGEQLTVEAAYGLL